jgi:hypothetical protein
MDAVPCPFPLINSFVVVKRFKALLYLDRLPDEKKVDKTQRFRIYYQIGDMCGERDGYRALCEML